LAEHVISEGVKVSVLKSGVLQIVVGILVVGSKLLLEDLELSRVEDRVGNGVTKHSNSAAQVILENGHADVRLFTARLTMEASAEGSNFIINLGTGVSLGATGQHVAEDVGSTSGGKSIVTGTSTDVNTNGGGLGGSLLGGHTDAISQSSDLEWTIHSKWGRNFTTRQVTEVGGGGVLGELLHALRLGEFCVGE
jgi:hypothetical protein